MRMETPCTDSNDAICVCNYNYFFNAISGRCEPCTVCPAGQGVLEHCEHDHDTLCEECVDDTFSDRESSLDPCLPCTICDEDTEKQLAECTPTSDSVCHGKSATHSGCIHTFSPGNSVQTKEKKELYCCLLVLVPFMFRLTYCVT